MNPKWPVYVPSKGRSDTAFTQKAFDAIGVPYKCVVQPQEADAYAAVLGRDKLLLLPAGLDGLVPTRNWIWDHAQAAGAARYWTFDDNVKGLYMLNHNLKVPVADGSTMRIIEDWTERWENCVISGMNYFMFAPRKTAVPPLVLNTRVYSNMLIQTDAKDLIGRPLRNQGVYNDDTDLCLRVLKQGNCTALFNMFLIYKLTTMTVKGGNTPIYQEDGRWKMARELQLRHPDVTTITRKWGRWQHQVDYSKFRDNRLVPKRGANVGEVASGVKLVRQQLVDGEWT